MKRMVDFASMVLLSLPAVALAQTYAGDVGIDPLADDGLVRTVWNRIVDSAERYK